MENEMEFEIDLRDMLYRILVKWRIILRGAVIIGLILFGYKLVTGLLANQDSEAMEKAMAKYELEVSDWESKGEQINTKIDSLRLASAQQKNYNEKSLLMKINPMDKWVGSFTLNVETDTQFDPSLLSVQLTNPALRYLMAYSGYLESNELYQTVLDNTDIVDEMRFLTEILTQELDSDSSTVKVSCVGNDQAEIRKILELVKACLLNKYAEYKETFGDHRIEILSESLYSTVDPGLDATQKANLTKITDYSNQISQLISQEEAWEKSPMPKQRFGTKYVIKQAVKFGIIGCAAGLFVMAGYFAMAYVFSRSMKTDSDWNVLGITVLGNMSRVTTNIKQTIFEKWIEKLSMKCGLDKIVIEGIGGRNWRNNEETQNRLIVNNLGGVLKERNLSKAVFVSAMDNAKAAELVAGMDKIDSRTPYVLAGNVLEDPETVKKMDDAQEVILLGKRYETKIDDVQKIRTLLSAFGKSVIGSVVLEDIG